MSEENVEVIRAMIVSVNRGNLSRLRAFYDSAFIETAAPRRWLLPLLPAAVVVAVAITWRRCKRRERDWNARTPVA